MAVSSSPRARDTILYGGLTAGVLDAFDATLFFGALGATPDRIAQHVASGLLGPASFDDGAASIVAGGDMLTAVPTMAGLITLFSSCW
jgi:hypothetical protein